MDVIVYDIRKPENNELSNDTSDVSLGYILFEILTCKDHSSVCANTLYTLTFTIKILCFYFNKYIPKDYFKQVAFGKVHKTNLHAECGTWLFYFLNSHISVNKYLRKNLYNFLGGI